MTEFTTFSAYTASQEPFTHTFPVNLTSYSPAASSSIVYLPSAPVAVHVVVPPPFGVTHTWALATVSCVAELKFRAVPVTPVGDVALATPGSNMLQSAIRPATMKLRTRGEVRPMIALDCSRSPAARRAQNFLMSLEAAVLPVFPNLADSNSSPTMGLGCSDREEAHRMSEVRVTHIGGPTVLIEIGGWRLLTDPTFDPPGKRYNFGWGTSSRKLAGPALSASEVGPIDAVLLSLSTRLAHAE